MQACKTSSESKFDNDLTNWYMQQNGICMSDKLYQHELNHLPQNFESSTSDQST